MKEALKRLESRFTRRPILWLLALCFAGSALCGLFLALRDIRYVGAVSEFLMSIISGMSIVGIVIALPAALSLANLMYLLLPLSSERAKAARKVEIPGIALGAWYSLGYADLIEICFADWDVQLYNSQMHTPIASWTVPTIVAIAAVAFAGYIVLRFVPMRHCTPLVSVFAIAAVYLGVVECILWCIQISSNDLMLLVFPVNLIIIAVRTVRDTVLLSSAQETEGRDKLSGAASLLRRASNWPWLGLLAAVPLLGLLVLILMLFGQEPDSAIRAWTETAEWTMSQKTAPPNLYYDEHYLCTVAAGGHRALVKPLREGERHGHRVLVNRQLCIANAFEDLIHERAPRFHKGLRDFYDKAGYPIARHIKTKLAADIVYFAMKPLEWLFLAVLYMFDLKPENRIAVQYPHSAPPAV